MAAPFSFQHLAEFLPDSFQDLLSTIPSAPGIFALSGQDPAAQPYLSHATDLRRRLRRLLAPADSLAADGQPSPSRRLNLRSRVRFIQWTPTGSEFESHLLLYHAARHAFGPDLARRRLRLHPPYMLRITLSGTHPRVYSTNRLTRKALPELFGPFPSRAAAERYGDAVLDLFQLRRCTEDLQPYPDHPGCVYGEMGKCLMPCKQGHPSACTPQQYAQEAQRVFAFFATHGGSLLSELAALRDAASQAMDFEAAAALHKQWEKVRSVALLADPLVGPINQLRLLVLQQALPPQADIADQRDSRDPNEPEDSNPSTHAAVFVFANGRWTGPQPLSTRALLSTPDHPSAKDHQTAADSPLAHPPAELSTVADALALLRRWYYRSQKHRSGEPFLPNPDGAWPIRRIRNAASRLLSAPRC